MWKFLSVICLLLFLTGIGIAQDFELSYSLVRVRDGAILDSSQAEVPRTPASTLKVVTAVASKEVLGLEHRFFTEVRTDAKLRRGRLYGDLILSGSADPELNTDVWEQMATALLETGVRSVRGDLIVDPGPYAEPLYGSGWAWDDTGSWYSPEITGLSVNSGLMELDPGELPTWVNHSSPDSKSSSASMTPGYPGVNVVGKIPGKVAAVRAPLRAGELFRRALASRGIRIRGAIIVKRVEGGRILVRHQSRTLKEILTRALAKSDNLAMELMWRAADLHKPQCMKQQKFRQTDGSGLSRYNLITASQFTNLLLTEPWLKEVLPSAGEGTLKKRFRSYHGKPVLLAKTGSMSNVSGLVGYLFPGTERECVFSILINSHLGTYAERKALEDSLVESWVKMLER